MIRPILVICAGLLSCWPVNVVGQSPGADDWKNRTGPVRIWNDIYGRYSVEAMLLRHESDRVYLKRVDNGKIAIVPLTRLGNADIDWLNERKLSSESMANAAPVADMAVQAPPGKPPEIPAAEPALNAQTPNAGENATEMAPDPMASPLSDQRIAGSTRAPTAEPESRNPQRQQPFDTQSPFVPPALNDQPPTGSFADQTLESRGDQFTVRSVDESGENSGDVSPVSEAISTPFRPLPHASEPSEPAVPSDRMASLSPTPDVAPKEPISLADTDFARQSLAWSNSQPDFLPQIQSDDPNRVKVGNETVSITDPIVNDTAFLPAPQSESPVRPKVDDTVSLSAPRETAFLEPPESKLAPDASDESAIVKKTQVYELPAPVKKPSSDSQNWNKIIPDAAEIENGPATGRAIPEARYDTVAIAPLDGQSPFGELDLAGTDVVPEPSASDLADVSELIAQSEAAVDSNEEPAAINDAVEGAEIDIGNEPNIAGGDKAIPAMDDRADAESESLPRISEDIDTEPAAEPGDESLAMDGPLPGEADESNVEMDAAMDDVSVAGDDADLIVTEQPVEPGNEPTGESGKAESRVSIEPNAAPNSTSLAEYTDSDLMDEIELNARVFWDRNASLSNLLEPLPPDLQFQFRVSGEPIQNIRLIGHIEFDELIDNQGRDIKAVRLPPSVPNPLKGWVGVEQTGLQGISPAANIGESSDAPSAFSVVRLKRPTEAPLRVERARGSLKLAFSAEMQRITLPDVSNFSGAFDNPVLTEKGIQIDVQRPDDVTLVVKVCGNSLDVAGISLQVPGEQQYRQAQSHSVLSVWHQFNFADSIPEGVSMELEIVTRARELVVPFDFTALQIPMEAGKEN